MPRLAAAVPYEMVFDEKQCEHYDSPSALEHLFAEDWGESIRHDYVVWLVSWLQYLQWPLWLSYLNQVDSFLKPRS